MNGHSGEDGERAMKIVYYIITASYVGHRTIQTLGACDMWL